MRSIGIGVICFALLALGCGPGDAASDGADAGTGTSDAETSGTGDGDGDDEPTPMACVDQELAEGCAWTPTELLVNWTTTPPPPFPEPVQESDYFQPSRHGLDPRFVLDGDAFVVAYIDEYRSRDREGERDPRFQQRLVIGTETAGVWETDVIVLSPGGLLTADIDVDATIRVGLNSRMYERREGEWTHRSWDYLLPHVLSDPLGGPDHTLFWNAWDGASYGRLVDEVSDLETTFTCDHWGQSHDHSPPDFELSPAGVPHVAQLSTTDNRELALFFSYLSDGEWVLEQVECLVNLWNVANGHDAPDLEFDADGNAHICVIVDRDVAPTREVLYFNNVGGDWSSEVAGEVYRLGACELGLDASGRVHILTEFEYFVRDAGGWTTGLSFEFPVETMQVNDEGEVYILREGLVLLSNTSGEWVERQLGVGYVP